MSDEREDSNVNMNGKKEEERDTRCSIVLVLSSSLSSADGDDIHIARDFVRRVISLSDKATTSTATSDETGKAIRHTLRNRYYDAEVWFWIVDGGVEGVVRGLGGRQRRDDEGGFGKFEGFEGADWSDDDDEEGGEEGGMKAAPAIIYLWTHEVKGEIEGLTRGMRRAGWDPEVCLAVRVGDGEGEEDAMFIDHGFEYIDARDRERKEEDDEDVPRLPRVLDALSTVMWPSMRTKDKATVTVTDEDEEDILRELMAVASLHHQPHDQDDSDFGEMVSSPVEYDVDAAFLSPFGLGAGIRRKVSMGFEDDFVQFSASHSTSSGFGSFDPDTDGGYVVLDPAADDDDDDDLPSESSIKRTAESIFPDGDTTDLDSIFTSLKDMRANIGRIESEDERRSVAARVALGVVYGFNLEEG